MTYLKICKVTYTTLSKDGLDHPRAIAVPRQMYAEFRWRGVRSKVGTWIDTTLLDPGEGGLRLVELSIRLHLPHPVGRSTPHVFTQSQTTSR
jgi:hypothetical protein